MGTFMTEQDGSSGPDAPSVAISRTAPAVPELPDPRVRARGTASEPGSSSPVTDLPDQPAENAPSPDHDGVDALQGTAPYVLPPEDGAPVDDAGLSGDAEGITGVPHPDLAADDARSEFDIARLRASNVDEGVYDSSSITVLEGLEADRKSVV